jgi:hypothetical protein
MSTDLNAQGVVRALVDAGLVEAARSRDAEAVVRTALERSAPVGGPSTSTPLRRRMSEIAGYVGGAFVVGAAVLFFSQAWTDLGLAEQVGLLLGSALVLALVGAGFVRAAGGRGMLRMPEEDVRRRLTSVLLTAAAACTAFGVGLLLNDAMDNDELVMMLAALTAAVAALGGYLVAPTTVGQLGTAFATFMAIPSGLGALGTGDVSPLPFGLGVLGLGVVWLVAAERHLWHETLPARLIGCAFALFGAQLPVFDDPAWIGYVATAVVGAVAFWMYVGTRAWPYLAVGVVAVTLAVPEALNDWFGGSLGAAGLLLAAGVTLLVAALLGLRLRQEVTEDEAAERPHAHAH